MFKKIIIEEGADAGEYYIGRTADIKALYKSLTRAAYKTNEGKGYRHRFFPAFSESPKFSESKRIYAIHIDIFCNYTVITSDCMMAILLEEGMI